MESVFCLSLIDQRLVACLITSRQDFPESEKVVLKAVFLQDLLPHQLVALLYVLHLFDYCWHFIAVQVAKLQES